VAESDVPGYEFSTWYGIQVPADTSPVIIAKLNADFTRVLQASDVRFG
jgi:tripartite-type tricarboxylate transporter receptor subunit TctC